MKVEYKLVLRVFWCNVLISKEMLLCYIVIKYKLARAPAGLP
jgi:hypothetical protein